MGGPTVATSPTENFYPPHAWIMSRRVVKILEAAQDRGFRLRGDEIRAEVHLLDGIGGEAR
jgi:hypothetical protein